MASDKIQMDLKYFSPEFQRQYEKQMRIEEIKKDFGEIQDFIKL